MKFFGRLVLPGILAVAVSSAFASDGGDQNTFNNDSLNDLTRYFLNLGKYLGYNLQSPPDTSSSGNQTSQNLLNLPALQVAGTYLLDTYLGSLIVNTAVPGATQFVPSNQTNPSAGFLNAFVNHTFQNPPFSSPAPDKVSVSTLIDQPRYQADPVSQAVLNIIGTPDYSYCLNNEGTDLNRYCNYPSDTKNDYDVILRSVGNIPGPQDYFTYKYNQPLLGQLNVNSLTSPLLYTATSTASANASNSPGASGTPASTQDNQGLVATSQAQQALNFIRFATGAVTPLDAPNRSDYDHLFTVAQNISGNHSKLEQLRAQATLASYLAKVRVFAAQSSVGIANLYYILSKRMPQDQGGSGSGQVTSQALSEFKMATWRLYNSDQQNQNTQWLEQINNASSATVQKEMAVLLAEINYQLYLNRQQQERLLLTNSILVLQNARNAQPMANFVTPGGPTNSPPVQ